MGRDDQQDDHEHSAIPLSSMAREQSLSNAVRATSVGRDAELTAANNGVRINFGAPSEPGFPGPMNGRARGATTASTALPASVMESLENIVDDNGVVSVDDLATIIDHQASMKQQYSQLKKLSLIFIGLLLFFGVLGGFAAYRLNANLKDSVVDGNVLLSKETRKPLATASTDTVVEANVMTSKETRKAIEVASVDTTISMDGTLLSRDHTGVESAVVSTSVATTQQPLTSLMSDAALRELRVLALTSTTDASIHLTVLGFIRLPPRPCRRSLVKIFTAAGVLMLDGTQLTFDTDVAGVLSEAGFESSENPDNADGTPAGSRRLLSDLSALMGLFNMVGRFNDSQLFKATHPDTSTAECDGVVVKAGGNGANNKGAADFNSLSQRFKLKAKGYMLCHLPPSLASLKNETDWCTRMGAVEHPTVAGLYFTEDITIAHDGVARRSAASKKSSWDTIERLQREVQDKTMGIVKSASVGTGGKLYDCKLSQLSSLPSIFDGMQLGTMRREQLEKTGRVGDDMEELWVVDVDSIGNKDMKGHDVPVSQVDFELHLRVWQTKSGLWRRFQVTDSRQWSLPTDARPLTWTWEKFYEVQEMVQVPAFPPETFQLNFVDADAKCTEDNDASKLPPLDFYPSHREADAFQEMVAIEGEQMQYYSLEEDLDKLKDETPDSLDVPVDDDDAASGDSTDGDATDGDATAGATATMPVGKPEPASPPKPKPMTSPQRSLLGLKDENGEPLLAEHEYMTEENISDADLRALLAQASGGRAVPTDAGFLMGMRAALSEVMMAGAVEHERARQAAERGEAPPSTTPTVITVEKSGTYDEQAEAASPYPRRSKSDRTGIVNPSAQWHPDDCEAQGGGAACARSRAVVKTDDSWTPVADDEDEDVDEDAPSSSSRQLLQRRRRRRLPRLNGSCTFRNGNRGKCLFRGNCRGGTQESGHCSGTLKCCVKPDLVDRAARDFGLPRQRSSSALATEACRSFQLNTFGLSGQLCGNWPNIGSASLSGSRSNIPLHVAITGHVNANVAFSRNDGFSGTACLGISVGAGAFGWAVARVCGSWCELELARACVSYQVRPPKLTISMRFGPDRAHGTLAVGYRLGVGRWSVVLSATIDATVWSGTRELLNRTYG